jgi:hypothetical protein
MIAALFALVALAGFVAGVLTVISFVSRFGGEVIDRTLTKGLNELARQLKERS